MDVKYNKFVEELDRLYKDYFISDVKLSELYGRILIERAMEEGFTPQDLVDDERDARMGDC